MILIPIDKVEYFTKKINDFKAIRPIQIESPKGYILPESVLEDEEIVKMIPELLDLTLIDQKDITFIKTEIL